MNMITSTSFGHPSAWPCLYYTVPLPYICICRERKAADIDIVKCTGADSRRKWGIQQQNLKPSDSVLLYHQDDHQIINDELLLATKHVQKLRRDVRNVVLRQAQAAADAEDSLLIELKLVDALQRLRIDHQFQEEIEALLLPKFYSYLSLKLKDGFSLSRPSLGLHQVSLSFRLLRQGGYYVAPDIFNKFMMNDYENAYGNGRFNLKAADIKALMELYEAAQLSIEGEDILDAAAEFSSQLLNSWTRCLDDDSCDATTIKHTLRHPYRKSLAAAASFFKSMENSMAHHDQFEGINGLGNCLRELWCAENHLARGIHRQELLQISKWWEDLGIAKDLKQARDEPKKWYTWSVACLNDLSLSDERVDLTKTISFIYLIDDIYDLYGDPEDLNLFTQAVIRWELSAIEQLPDYMKKCFIALYGFTNEAGLNIQKKHGFNPIESLRKMWADLCTAFLTESRWFASGSKNLPKADEYLENGKVSSGVPVVLVHSFFLLGFGSARRSSITLDHASSIISSVAAILRLWDDLGSSRDEGQNGNDGSYINYYVNDHQGVSVEFGIEHVSNLISDEWKRLNMECLRLNKSSRSFQMAALNLARMVPLMYSYNDNQHLPDLQDYIKFIV